jgi:transcriptional regulator
VVASLWKVDDEATAALMTLFYRNLWVEKLPPIEALRGSLDLLVLKTLSLVAMHGWGISQRIQQTSKGVLEVNQGSLYPALQRLEKNGLIASDWGTTDNNRRARYYRLTAAGRRALGDELESWKRFAAGLEAVLRTT